jgi:hypothetical protein
MNRAKKVIFRWTWLVGGGLVAVAGVCLFLPKINEHTESISKSEALQASIEVKEARLRELKRFQHEFRNEPRFLEQLAHNKGFLKPGEVIYTFAGSDE